MIAEAVAAVKALLGPLPFYDGQVPATPTFPYRVLFFNPGYDRRDRLCVTSNVVEFYFQVTHVGLTTTAVAIVSEQTRNALADKVLHIDGWTCTPLRRQSSTPIRPDDGVTDTATGLKPLFTAETYAFRAFKN